MNKQPFFLSPPRTRSSVLFQLMQFYAIKKLGLKPVRNHIELFLEFSHNDVFMDLKTNEQNLGELYPVVKPDGLHVHFVSPPVFNNAQERNLHKLKVLQGAKENGNNYFIKATVNVVDTPNEILDFFSDRHWVITKRRNTEEFVLSFLYARTAKLFNARTHNVDRYRDTLDKGVVVADDLVQRVHILLDKTKKVYEIEQQLIVRNIDYSLAYYEDMPDWESLYNKITEIYGTQDWKEYLSEDFLDLVPIKVEKDYTKCILNYDDIIGSIRKQIEESGIDKL